MFSRRLLQFSLSFDRAANKLACYMRARVFVAPCEPFATSPPYRAACAPDALPFLERFQHASRKVRDDFALADAKFIHAQMQEHYWEEDVGFEVKVNKGFTELKPSNYTAEAGEPPIDFRVSPADKSNMAKYLFGGFQRCL
ncbi:MAG: hypothetical protein ABR989_05610 [Candidatus Binatus soli]|jgi:hypothetical protein